MEEIILPRPTLPKGIYFQGGRCRSMAHSRDRIPVWHSEEGVRRVALGMVLHQRCCSPESNPAGLPKFSTTPLKKRTSWRPRSIEEGDSAEIKTLASKIRVLANFGLSIIKVMAISITRCVQPLQSRGLPMWHYNREDDASRCGRKGPDNFAALTAMLADLFKGEKEDFTRLKCRRFFHV